MTPAEQGLIVEALKDLEKLMIDAVGVGIAELAGDAAPFVKEVEAAILPKLEKVVDDYIASKFPTASLPAS